MSPFLFGMNHVIMVLVTPQEQSLQVYRCQEVKGSAAVESGLQHAEMNLLWHVSWARSEPVSVLAHMYVVVADDINLQKSACNNLQAAVYCLWIQYICLLAD